MTIAPGPRSAAPAGPCDARLRAGLAAAGIPAGLLLIRNAHGSRNPREAMQVDDPMAAAAAFAPFLQG